MIFRAKGTDEKDKEHWYEGGYVMLSDTTYCFEEDYMRAAREGNDPRHHYIIFERMTDWGLPNKHLRADIRPETLCMSTEYVKDNKYVFEGDIIKFENAIGVVRFGKYQNTFDTQYAEHYGFYIEWQGDSMLRKDIGYWMNDDTTKVIGNIVDNPELLKELKEND